LTSIPIASGPEPQLFDGRFAVERLIGRGGMAEVYLARDVRHDRPVAIKVMRPDVLDTIGIERFRREIKVTGSFSHPHILPLLESGETSTADGGRVLYYVTPFIEGETLRDRLAREPHYPVLASRVVT
jgi:serine/threonine-protein kinase